MNTTTPTPRLVPDRPSDAAIANAVREVAGLIQTEAFAFRGANTHTPRIIELCQRLELIAREIDAAAPPAEAPAERDLVERVALAIANVVGHGMAEKCEAQARAAILAMAAAPDWEDGTDYLGAALELEAHFHKPESQTMLRAMVHAARALRIANEKRHSAPAAPAEGDYAGEVVNFTNGMTASGPPMTIIAAKPLPYGTKLYTTPRVTGGREAQDAARYRWLRDRHDRTHQDWHVRDPFNNAPDIGRLDAAIDAAMKDTP